MKHAINMTVFHPSKSIFTAVAFAVLLSACGNGSDPANQLFGESLGKGVDTFLTTSLGTGTPLGAAVNSMKMGELVGKTVGKNFDEEDRKKLAEATKLAAAGEKQTFTSSKGEKVVAQKTGKPEVKIEGGQKKKCQKVEQQVAKADGKIESDVVTFCDPITQA